MKQRKRQNGKIPDKTKKEKKKTIQNFPKMFAPGHLEVLIQLDRMQDLVVIVNMFGEEPLSLRRSTECTKNNVSQWF